MNPTIFWLVPRLGLGGLELFLLRLIPHLSQQYRIIVISLDSSDILTKIYRNRGITVENLNFFTAFSIIPSLIKMNRLIKKYNPKLIQSFLYPSDLYTVLIKIFLWIKIPIFWAIRTTGLPKKSKVRSQINFLFVVIFSHLIPRKILSCSDEASEQHIIKGYTSKNHYVITNFSDYWTTTTRSNSKLLYEKKPAVIKIGLAARYTNGKSHEMVCQLIENLHDNTYGNFVLTFCGQNTNLHGDLHNFIEQNYPKIVNHCEFLGNLFASDYSKWHQDIDLFCLPSITEGVPNAFLEACTIGTPIIGTALKSVRNMCDEKVLIKTDELNVTSLAEKIKFWLDLEVADRIDLCKINRDKSIKNFSRQNVVINYLNFYNV